MTPAVGSNVGAAVAADRQHSDMFGFHQAPQIIRAVHAVEENVHLFRDDRAFRMVLTVADQTIQGGGSVKFTQGA